MLIYKITNKVNGKLYIGKTTRPLEVRWAQHVLDAQNGSRLRFHRSIRKHGADQFKVEVIHKADSLESLDQLERSSIAEYKSCDRRFGYNLTMGGDGATPGELNPMFGKTHSDEVKQKLRELRLGTSQSEATRKKISAAVSGVNNPFFGKTHTGAALEGCRKGGLSHTGKKRSQETRDRISAALRGKAKSEAHCKAISEAKRKKDEL